jgi:Leucine-rich repeat (LRR) protein
MLGYNKIDQLGGNTFRGLINLEYIGLQGNRLQNLHPDTFVDLPKLQGLDLAENIGLQLPTDRNFINSLSVKYLNMSHCIVSSVSVETFANVSALQVLDLSDNNLRSVDLNILKVLPNLSHLDLKINQISEIIPGTCEMISFLEYLDLGLNEIEHLESDVFCGLVNL